MLSGVYAGIICFSTRQPHEPRKPCSQTGEEPILRHSFPENRSPNMKRLGKKQKTPVFLSKKTKKHWFTLGKKGFPLGKTAYLKPTQAIISSHLSSLILQLRPDHPKGLHLGSAPSAVMEAPTTRNSPSRDFSFGVLIFGSLKSLKKTPHSCELPASSVLAFCASSMVSMNFGNRSTTSKAWKMRTTKVNYKITRKGSILNMTHTKSILSNPI